ncbi:MAG: thiol-disulfide oxidoreductase DCC family protein [Thermoplasmatota archaeon]
MGKADAPPAIVLYDDRCGFCTTNAKRGMRYQRAGALRWLGNSTPEAQEMLRERGLSGKEEETLIVLDGERAYLESDAVVRSAQGLRWPWRVYAGLRFLPKSLRDRAYRKIAEDRDRHGCHLPATVAPKSGK